MLNSDLTLSAVGLCAIIASGPLETFGLDRGSRVSRETSMVTSSIKSDEEVVFYPTSAYLNDDGESWSVPIHGIIYEPEIGSRKRNAMVSAIAKALKVKSGTLETNNLNQRVRLFLVDNERRKEISVRLGKEVHAIGKSGPNGHFSGTVRLPASEVQRLVAGQKAGNPFLAFSAVVRKADDRMFTGRVQFVGRTGISVISDIDDTIKHTQVGDHKRVLANTFLNEFKPVPGMPELYRAWAQKDVVFHYVSGSPWQLYLPLTEFFDAERIPYGSFDLKYFRLKDPSTLGLLRSPQATKIRAIEPIMNAFPKRRFILIGDSGEEDPEIYTEVAEQRGDQVVAILIRNVTDATSGDSRFRAIREKLGNASFCLFDQPAELRPIVATLIQSDQYSSGLQ